ncbi:MAG: prepilin-type N-terminal cleavage/methylation domain-containing protein [bacterium]|nr:prepilin-type N-terminal cleavage/methylation domain-containing protein [bacterium]
MKILHSPFSIPHSALQGFTLVELLVSIGIFTIMTGVVLANYRTYNTNANFANSSEDIVLALRQAQVYGVSVKGESSSFNIPYGVSFDISSTGKPNQIILFADKDSDGIYAPASDSIVQTITWQSPIGITALECGSVPCTGGVLNVTFKRPNPDARITQGATVDDSVQIAKITVGNGGTKTSTITISKAGQISIQ